MMRPLARFLTGQEQRVAGCSFAFILCCDEPVFGRCGIGQRPAQAAFLFLPGVDAERLRDTFSLFG